MKAHTARSDPTDEALYSLWFEDNNGKSADELSDRYGDDLTLYISGYVRDPYETEDLVIEAFSRMFVKRRPVNAPGSFRAYLFKIARHLVFRHLKYNIPFIGLDDIDFVPQAEELTDAPIYDYERDRQLYDAIGKLKAEYREALYLIYFEDMSYAEVGLIMNKSVAQVKKLAQRGRERLKLTLGGEGFIYVNE